jgi:hypothetical protein
VPDTVQAARPPWRWWPAAAGGAGLVAVTGWAAGRTGDGAGAWIDLAWVLLTAGPVALAWLIAALGVGWPLQRWLAPRTDAPLATRTVLGVAGMLVIDGSLGRIGVPVAGAWLVTGLGIVLAVTQLGAAGRRGPSPAPSRILLLAAPASAILLVAAASAPGWLWASEFGGYDALSYHLQLPKEWIAAGSIEGLPHNVYAHLPSFVEAAYVHVALLTGDAIAAAPACQLLHAAMTVLTAAVVGRCAARLGGPRAAALAAVVVIATPWTAIVGSLAYNEMAVALLLAGALLLLGEEARDRPVARGAALGLLAGAACGAKLTALGTVAVPVGALVLLQGGPIRTRLVTAATAAAVAAAVLAPWLVANAIETGNPVFPFAASLLGAGHWSAEQVQAWSEGHGFTGGVGERVAAAWNEWFRYGIGPSPDPAEPWAPQWSLLPWAALAGAAIGCATGRFRAAAARLVLVLALQIGFWIALTHVKSRFMTPAVVPAALLVVIGVLATPWTRSSRRLLGIPLALLLAAHAALVVFVYAGEKDGRPGAAIGAVDLFAGDLHALRLDETGLTDPQRTDLLATAPPALWINHLLDDGARVLAVGDAAPFYYRRPLVTYHTTWDRGPLARAVAADPDPSTWIEALRAEGYTHLLVDPTMLVVWQRSGWLAPGLDPDVIVPALEERLPRRLRFANGMLLYEL